MNQTFHLILLETPILRILVNLLILDFYFFANFFLFYCFLNILKSYIILKLFIINILYYSSLAKFSLQLKKGLNLNRTQSHNCITLLHNALPLRFVKASQAPCSQAFHLFSELKDSGNEFAIPGTGQITVSFLFCTKQEDHCFLRHFQFYNFSRAILLF